MEQKNDKKIGVIIARLQPIHNGHLALIEKAYKENDEVYVFIGSADKFNQRNPLPISLRLQLTNDAIKETFKPHVHQMCDGEEELVGGPDKIHVVPLDDLTDENDNSHDWGFYLYSKIVSETYNPNFTIYYSDGFEIITTWFPSFLLRNNVSLSLLARNATVEGICATKIREYILKENDEELKKYVPKCVFEMRKTIKQHIELSKLIK
jgi:cytidyltransferase-like protein